MNTENKEKKLFFIIIIILIPQSAQTHIYTSTRNNTNIPSEGIDYRLLLHFSIFKFKLLTEMKLNSPAPIYCSIYIYSATVVILVLVVLDFLSRINMVRSLLRYVTKLSDSDCIICFFISFFIRMGKQNGWDGESG